MNEADNHQTCNYSAQMNTLKAIITLQSIIGASVLCFNFSPTNKAYFYSTKIVK